MEEFRKKVEGRLRFYSVFCACSFAFYLGLQFLTEGASEFAQGLTSGLWCGLECVAICNLVRLYATMRNEEKLREMYIKETDERNAAIGKETSQTGGMISSAGIALAAITAGFFSKTVCITLTCALIFTALVMIGVRAYYNKKM